MTPILCRDKNKMYNQETRWQELMSEPHCNISSVTDKVSVILNLNTGKIADPYKK